MYRKNLSSAAENTGSRKINIKNFAAWKKKFWAHEKKTFLELTHEQWTGKFNGRWLSFQFFPFLFFYFFPFIFSYRYFYTCCIGLSMYTKIYIFCFPLHTQYHFNAVVASCMQPKYRWIFFSLCCKHQYDAQRSHTLWQSRIGYDCNWIRSKSITIEKIVYWKIFLWKFRRKKVFVRR